MTGAPRLPPWTQAQGELPGCGGKIQSEPLICLLKFLPGNLTLMCVCVCVSRQLSPAIVCEVEQRASGILFTFCSGCPAAWWGMEG